MSLDIAKLQNVREHGGKMIARCPACAEAGMDETGEHLVIQADGRFGCVVRPGLAGKPHRQRIAKLAGSRSCSAPTIKVRAATPALAQGGKPIRVCDAAPVAAPLLRNEAQLAPIYSLECSEPNFREPKAGEWIVGLYRENDGATVPLLLWADPNVDLFWDLARREHVKPPRSYLRLAEQPQLDPISNRPIIGGTECPF